MDGFSGTLRLTDLNDFIAPTQECIKPVHIERKSGIKGGTIKISAGGDYSEVDAKGQETKLAKASITLNDCLACSGCITSAETILVQQQSTEELCRLLEENAKMTQDMQKIFVISFAPQPVASIAARYGFSMDECYRRLSSFFRSLGVNRVFDLSPASALSLNECLDEFLHRFENRNAPDTAPMLTSACPGWICYAEKTHGSFILPYISTTKSPQQIMGSLVKSYLATKERLSADRIFHVTLMMCYDKKLEASRDDFYDDIYRTRDVDLVVTSVEVEQMLEKRSLSLSQFPPTFCDTIPGIEAPIGHYEGNAGGFFEFIFRTAAQRLFQKNAEDIEYKIIRNKDLKELTLELDGETKLRFAAAYGFRNIQNIVQKMKRGKCPYDFVEIMACPSACVNGGGQIRPPEGQDSKTWLDKVETVYQETVNNSLPQRTEWMDRLYTEWLDGKESPKSLRMLHTRYHSLENKGLNLNIKW